MECEDADITEHSFDKWITYFKAVVQFQENLPLYSLPSVVSITGTAIN